MDLKKVRAVMQKFAQNVVVEAKKNAPQDKTSGKLRDSIKASDPYVTADFSMVSFFMEDYGKYQDLGVKGVKSGKSVGKKYYGSQAREYKYTSKGGRTGLKGMPPPSSFDRFSIRKGLAPRDIKGRFTGRAVSTVGFRKSITFLIARSIFTKGIKPTLFFTKPFIKYFKNLPSDVARAYGEDFETLIQLEFNKDGNI